MRNHFIWKKHGRRIAVVLLVAGILLPFGDVARSSSAQAKSSIRLSATKKNYFLHGIWDKLTLKNVPSGAKIHWKSTDKKVVRVREHIKNGIWYQVERDGKATVTATYKGKKYSCRIRVRREVEKPESPSSAPIIVSGDVRTEAECAPEATPESVSLSSPTPTAGRVVASAQQQAIYDQKIADFKERYISEGMSEYDKVDAICRFISYEFDYDKHEEGWFMMVVNGAGDCAASRYGVYSLCTDLGIRSFICMKVEDHGQTMVRIDDDVYMTVTGFSGGKPRKYWLYPMSEAELSEYLLRYPASKYLLGLA